MTRATRMAVLVVALVMLARTPLSLQGQAPAQIPDLAGRVLTVNGPIDPAQLGHTLMHEHVFINLTLPDDELDRWALAGRQRLVGSTAVGFYNAPLTMDMLGAVMLGHLNRDNQLLTDEKVALQEVRAFKTAGGGTIVDATSIGLDRDPEKLRRIALASGLNIVMGASWYQKAWHPRGMDARTVDSLTDEIVRDVTVGVGGTAIRSGIIGEVGTIGGPLTANEIKVIRASGRASRLTGAAVTLHTAAAQREQPKILDVLAAEGADLQRVVIGHSDSLVADIPFARQLIQRGAYIQFDLLGRAPMITRRWATDAEVARGIVELIKAGHVERILLSQDVCLKYHLKAYGGSGYSYIEEFFIPYLKRQGVTDAQINTMVVENPKRVLTFAAPRSMAPRS